MQSDDDNRSSRDYDIEHRKKFLGITSEDAARMKELDALFESRRDSMLDELYGHFLAQAETRSFFQSDRHIENLKAAQGKFLARLTSGVYDNDYRDSRLSVGRTHERAQVDAIRLQEGPADLLLLARPLVFGIHQS